MPTSAKPAEPPKFSGKNQDIREWLNSMEQYLYVGGCPPEQRTTMAVTFLVPKVANHCRMRDIELRRDGRTLNNWETFTEEMLSGYGSADPES